MVRILSLISLIGFICINVNANRQSTSTTVAVLEIGTGGTVRKTTSTNTHATVKAVSSFWAHLHDMGNHARRTTKNLPPAGMNMVPDFFQKANGGLLVGLSLVDMTQEELASMNTIQSILDSTHGNVVGYFDMKGSHMKSLLQHRDEDTSECCFEFGKKLDDSVDIIVSSPKAENKVQSISLKMSERNTDSAAQADSHVSKMLNALTNEAQASGSTYIVHLVMEQTGSRNHLMMPMEGDSQSRRLEQVEAQEEEEGEGDGSKNGSVYYGYGYYDANGNWYTPYRTIFQMQFYQVCLWTALGLFSMVLLSMGKMVNMHLMPDTLLHGESAKMSIN